MNSLRFVLNLVNTDDDIVIYLTHAVKGSSGNPSCYRGNVRTGRVNQWWIPITLPMLCRRSIMLVKTTLVCEKDPSKLQISV